MLKKYRVHIIIAVLVLLALIALFFYMRYNSLKKQTTTQRNTNTNSNTTSGGGSTGGGGSTSTGSTSTPAAEYHGTDITKWKAGDVLTAKSIVNVYETQLASQSNIATTFNMGDKIGTVEFVSAGWVKVKYTYVNWIGYSSNEYGYIIPSNNVTN